MNQVFTLRSQLVGRAGPNRHPWDVFELSIGGIDAIISVNDGELVHAEDLASVNIDYCCIPLSEDAPPRSGDLEHCIEALPKALQFILDEHTADKTVLIHCTSGKDRTGLLMSYYLCVSEGLSPLQAIKEVKHVRPIALSAPGWDDFALEVLGALTVTKPADK
jgi:protein-tyrosine phosphatase